MDQPLDFLTFEDVARAGACAHGVLLACDAKGFFWGTPEQCIAVFPNEADRIRRAARLDGDGDGDGDGYGDGDGDGDGYGYGYGDGDGDGDGDGYGDGDGGLKLSNN